MPWNRQQPARSHHSLSVLSILVALMLTLGSTFIGTASARQAPICAPLQTGTPSAVPASPVALEPPAAPEGAIDVTVGYLPVSIFAPVFVAFEKGYFAEEGLNVTLESLPGGSDMVVLTATGELDLGIGGIGPAYWNAAAQDLGVTIIAPGHAEGSPVASPLMISTAACEDGSIASVADLAGKRVSVNAPGATEYWLASALGTGGLTLDDVEQQFLSFPDAIVALEAGALDAAIIGEPLATKAEQDGLAVRLLPDFPVQDIQPTMVFGNEAWLADNPDAATGFVTGYLRAARDLTDNFNDPVNLAIIETYTGVPPALVAASVKPVYATDGAINLDSLSLLQTFFRERGQLDYDDDIDPATMIDTRFVDEANGQLGGE